VQQELDPLVGVRDCSSPEWITADVMSELVLTSIAPKDAWKAYFLVHSGAGSPGIGPGLGDSIRHAQTNFIKDALDPIFKGLSPDPIREVPGNPSGNLTRDKSYPGRGSLQL